MEKSKNWVILWVIETFEKLESIPPTFISVVGFVACSVGDTDLILEMYSDVFDMVQAEGRAILHLDSLTSV
jgi:hypothetical protein